MYGKIEISGVLKILTGLHIGGSSEFSAIGAVDSPVMRDILTEMPIIPGSSLKGKIRYLLYEKYRDPAILKPNHNNDDPRIKRLFGSSNDSSEEKPLKSRVYFSDLFIGNKEALNEIGIKDMTEVKSENTIDRFSAVANPRQIERVIRGVDFDINIMYTVLNPDEIIEDFTLLKEGFKLLGYDYLGGSGSRGYGRVAFEALQADLVVGDVDREILEEINKILE